MNVREWEYRDLGAIAELEKECFTTEPWNMRMLAESFLSGRFYGVLIEEEGMITAYGGIRFAADEAEIELIATAEMYRRCGRGGEVLRELLREASLRKIARVFLEVRVSNAAAQMLYLRHGFVGTYVRSRYYADGEDAIVMKKEID